MHPLPAILLAASAVSAIPSRSRAQILKERANRPSGTSTISQPTSTPLFGGSAPEATYLPTVHWDTNTTSTNHLAPNDYHKFYYAENGVNDPQQTAGMAFVAMNFTMPSVALEHTDAVTNVQCPSNNSMIVTFDCDNSLNYALRTWPSNGTDFMLVSYFEGCGSHANGERSYFYVGNFTFSHNDSTITANGYNLATIDAADFMSIEFGVTNPPNEMPPNVPNPYGFAQAPLGDDFDDLLDDLIGFVDINETHSGSFASSLTSGLEEVDDTEEMTDDEVKNDDLSPEDLSSLNDTFVGTVQLFNSSTKRSIKLPHKKRIVHKRQSFTPTILDTSIEVPKDPHKDEVDSPFGKAVKIGDFPEGAPDGQKMTVYCVDCGFKGKLVIKGRLDVNLNIFTGGPKVVKAEINVDGSLSAGLQLGFDAQVIFKQEIKKNIVAVPIPPNFAIFGICSIGPQLTLDAKFTLELNATGQMLVGATLNMPKPTSTLDLLDSKNSKSSGWDPELKPVFKASGKIAASAELGFPIGLGIGVNILNGLVDVKCALVEEPSLKATMTVQGSVSTRDIDGIPSLDAPVEHNHPRALIAERVPVPDPAVPALITRDDECQGVNLELKFINRVYFDLLGKKGDDLAHNEIDIAKKCFEIGKVNKARATIDNSTLAHANATSSGTTFDYELPSINEASYTDSRGNTYGVMMETSNSDLIITCEEGNIFLHPAAEPNSEIPGCVTSWISKNTTTVADASGRVMHYYSDTMDKVGVSRLRMSEEDEVPVSAVFATIQPSKQSNSTSTYGRPPSSTFAVVDLDGHNFYPILCDIEGQSSKVFLANDADKGPQTLMDPNLMYSITGGVVESCAPLDFTTQLG